MLTLFAATLTVRANDKPLFIELEFGSEALPSAVNATGSIVVGNRGYIVILGEKP